MAPRLLASLLAASSLAGLLLFGAGCGDDDDEESQDPSRSSTTSFAYVTALADGLYCLGYEGDGQPRVELPAPRLWLAYPLVPGASFQAAECGPSPVVRNTVLRTDVLETPAGSFRGVAVIGNEHGCYETWVADSLGVLQTRSTTLCSRGVNLEVVDQLRIASGPDAFANRFGIAVGNVWRYHGSDSTQEGSGESEIVRTVRGTTAIAGRTGYVLEDVQTFDAGAVAHRIPGRLLVP